MEDGEELEKELEAEMRMAGVPASVKSHWKGCRSCFWQFIECPRATCTGHRQPSWHDPRVSRGKAVALKACHENRKRTHLVEAGITENTLSHFLLIPPIIGCGVLLHHELAHSWFG